MHVFLQIVSTSTEVTCENYMYQLFQLMLFSFIPLQVLWRNQLNKNTAPGAIGEYFSQSNKSVLGSVMCPIFFDVAVACHLWLVIICTLSASLS